MYPESKTKAMIKKDEKDGDMNDLRQKHFQNKLIENINKVLQERNKVKVQQFRSLLKMTDIPADKRRMSLVAGTSLLDPTFLTSVGGNYSSVSFYKASDSPAKVSFKPVIVQNKSMTTFNQKPKNKLKVFK